MELRQLRYFLGVCEAGSLLKASARLHVAQPALGQQMSTLEDELGVRLLLRSSKGVTPTSAGNAFLEHAKLVLADVERASQAVREAGSVPSGSVAIGLPTTVSLGATLPILRACRERLPQVRLKIVEAYSGFLKEWLQSGRLDVAILFGDKPESGLSKLQASRIASDRMSRRVVCATNVTRPSTPTSSAVIALIQEVIHDMVASKSWPGHWIDRPRA